MTSEYLTRKALADKLGLPVKTLRRLHKSGELKGIPVSPAGRLVLYRMADVEAYLERRKGAA